MYETILAPTDGSDGARRAVHRAVDLATLFNADLHLLYVVDTDQFSADKPREEVEDMLADIEEEGERDLTELEELARGSSVDSVETSIRRGIPHEEILGYVDDHEIKLVVMGSHGQGGYESVHLGNVATEVASRIEEPLLLI